MGGFHVVMCENGQGRIQRGDLPPLNFLEVKIIKKCKENT